MNYLIVGFGGMIGAMMRYGVDHWFMNSGQLTVRSGDFPWGTLIVNLTGSALLGLLIVFTFNSHSPHDSLWLFLAVGVLGSYTTMSTFALDSVLLGDTSNSMMLAYIAATVLGSVAIVLGIWKAFGHTL